MTEPLTNQQLDEIETRLKTALHCPNAAANGRLDGQHTLTGGFTHIRCELCDYSRPRGERVEETAALLAEVRRQRAVLNGVRAKHKPRTERHGSGCVQCGIVWPCPTYKALDETAAAGSGTRPVEQPATDTNGWPGDERAEPGTRGWTV